MVHIVNLCFWTLTENLFTLCFSFRLFWEGPCAPPPGYKRNCSLWILYSVSQHLKLEKLISNNNLDLNLLEYNSVP